jgi:hypothetical protein
VKEVSAYKYTEYPYARILRDFTVRGGDVTRFVVQLEYGLGGEFFWPENYDEWEPVARFDHNPQGSDGHDVRDEGLHLDVYRGDGQYERTWDFPHVPVNEAPRWCEAYFEKNLDFLLERFEQLRGIEDGRRTVTFRR